MPTVSISPQPKLQFFDAAGNPLVGGKLYTYAAGTTTPLTSYTDSTGNIANTNPVILDARGEASVWMTDVQYKLALFTAADVPVWTVDGVNGADQATLATLAASGGSALIGFLQAGTAASARTVQSKLRDIVSVKDFGAVGNGSANDTLAVQAALNTGNDVVIPTACNCSVTSLTMSTAGQRLYGQGFDSIITGADPTLNLITVSADNVTICDLRINGTATSNANQKFGVFTATATPANFLRIERVMFSGATSGVGLNNAVKFDDSCNYGMVFDCRFERLWGNISGTGYGVLVGAATGVQMLGNTWVGSSGRGRHGFYLSAGASRCKITGNFVSSSDYESITLNSQSAQPANTDNIVLGNTILTACVAIPGVTTGAISIFGHASGNLILGNTIRGSKGCGIKLDGTGVVDLADTHIRGNQVFSSDYIGIDLLSAVGGSLTDNRINESSVAVTGTYSNIRLVSDGTTATSNWLINGNLSSGATYARSAFQLNSTAPTPTNLKVMGNKFDTCNLTDVELNSVVCAIDGYIRFTQGSVSYGPIANGSSVSTGYTIPGTSQGDVVSVGHTSNCDGTSVFGYANGTDSVTVVVLNNSGGSKTIASGTLSINVFKRTP